MRYKDTCNRRLNWNVYSKDGEVLAAVGVNSAILAIQARDRFIGWDSETRRRCLNRVANNYRFALRRKEKNLGSRILRILSIVARKEWKHRYGDDVVLLETLVKPPWGGTVYKAAGWTFLGMTKGHSFSKAPLKLWQKEDSARGELARRDPKAAIQKYAVGGEHYHVQQSEPKKIFVRPLVNDWREALIAEGIKEDSTQVCLPT
jgi:hypothetical protein